MRNSSTFQANLREGEEIGEANGQLLEAHGMLMLVGRRRLGEPDAATAAAIESVHDVTELERLTLRALDVETWSDQLGRD